MTVVLTRGERRPEGRELLRVRPSAKRALSRLGQLPIGPLLRIYWGGEAGFVGSHRAVNP
jgi:hypothetical protein